MATFGWAMDRVTGHGDPELKNVPTTVRRCKQDEKGVRHWRRIIFLSKDGKTVCELWPSGFHGPYTPSQEDMVATDWELF